MQTKWSVFFMRDTKELIIRTSLKLFMQKGFKEVTMSEIIKEADSSKGAVYHHFESKEQIFEEAVKYFYNNMMITNYNDFPQTSLKAFYNFYLKRLENTPDDTDEGANILAFFSDAIRRVPSFTSINETQKNKELSAWTSIVFLAKEKREIQTDIPNENIALMFLNISDGIALNRMITNRDIASGNIKNGWDDLYKLLINS